jgi:hypothetical protein
MTNQRARIRPRRVAGTLFLSIFSSLPHCHHPIVTQPANCWTHAALDGGRMSCQDGDPEPNDTVATATGVIPGVSCGSSQLSGTIAGDDVDVFAFDAALCEDKPKPPTLTFNGDLKKSALRMCLFLACTTGMTALGDPSNNIPGCAEGDATFLPEGMLGCCATEGNVVSPHIGCTDGKGTLHAYVVVDSTAEQCTPYTLKYDFSN